MNRKEEAAQTYDPRVPRARGDEPVSKAVIAMTDLCSPRPRG